jgi:diguanylate cyclase (GGDEF)-like protein
MKKEDIKSLIAQVYKNLIEKIDAQTDDINREQVINYLEDVTSSIASLSNDEITAIAHEKSTFKNEYKELANKSLDSYSNTSNKFEKIAKMHEKTISEYTAQSIDISTMTEKFNDIQNHMLNEVSKANNVINSLSKQVKELEQTSNVDPLTKVFNRRALSTYLQPIFLNNKRHYEMHLLMLDLDDFKLINDRFGHIAGDKILIFLANILKKTLRDGDKIFRYGGEEFLIILNRLDEELCKKIVDRVLSLVRNNNLIYKGEKLNVTISVGATKLKNGDTEDSFINRADKALYKAKNNGKNQMQMEL